ncbi:hypothetical protein PVK06_042804 [Gossypium arboreum]|uniref:Uncharacterized protein n=1 Tax=Gossypium arboreum TaxID=29729 RepID=A0ABR0MLS3_GOSAR|nr:hypothetical protein PVK06_042804 [Gossypium arboreum]
MELLGLWTPHFSGFKKYYCREFDLDIVALLETKVSGGRARGIWMCWKSSVTMEVIANHRQFVVFHVEILGVVCPFFLTFVYGSPQGAKRRALWEDLSIVANFINSPWVIMVDFNALISLEDKKKRKISKKMICSCF